MIDEESDGGEDDVEAGVDGGEECLEGECSALFFGVGGVERGVGGWELAHGAVVCGVAVWAGAELAEVLDVGVRRVEDDWLPVGAVGSGDAWAVV